MEASRRPRSPALRIPAGIPAVLGRAISAIHSCAPESDLRRVLEIRRKQVLDRYRRVFERQARLGTIAQDDAERSAGILLSLPEAVFCHGDLNLNNVIVDPEFGSNGRIGIIDFGNTLWAAREFDFATFRLLIRNFSNREPLFNGVVAAYQEHGGHAPDMGLVDDFTSLLSSVRKIKKSRGG